MTFGKFALYVGLAYLAYYSINLILDFVRASNPTAAKEDYESFEVGAVNEKPQRIESIDSDSNLDNYQEKKN